MNYKLIFFFCVMTANIIHPMNQIKPCKRDNNISFKSLHGFPCVNLRKGHDWYTTLTRNQKQKVRKRFQLQNQRLLLLFNVATRLPLDLQRVIALHIFNHNKNAAEKFLRMPVMDVIIEYGLAKKIFQKQSFAFQCTNVNYLYSSLSSDPACSEDTIFEFLDELLLFQTVCGEKRACTKNELEAIAKIAQTFKSIAPFHQSYEYSIPLTCKGFVQEWSRLQLMYHPTFLATYISFILPSSIDVITSNDRIKFNQLANEFNTETQELCGRSRDRGICDARVNSLAENSYLPNRFALIKGGAWVAALLFYLNGFCVDFTSKDLNNMLANPSGMFKIPAFYWATYLGLCFYLYQFEVYFLDNPLLGLAYSVGFYGLLSSFYALYKIKSVREEYVKVEDISQLLENKEIAIF